jgi:hypothetical protein
MRISLSLMLLEPPRSRITGIDFQNEMNRPPRPIRKARSKSARRAGFCELVGPPAATQIPPVMATSKSPSS